MLPTSVPWKTRTRAARKASYRIPRLTLFSIPKPFTGHIGIIQRNAVTSWTLLDSKPEIILLGEEQGTRELANHLGLAHIPDIERNEHGTPLISSALAEVKSFTRSSTLCYVNSDIILMPHFAAMIERNPFSTFLLIGRRTNLWVGEAIDFSASGWERSLTNRLAQEGVLHSHWGADYFVFPRDLWPDWPPFAVGRLMWDNWLIFDARSRGIPVVDATPAAVAVHQNHESDSNIVLQDGEWDWSQPEVQANLRLAGGPAHAYNVYDATWVLTRNGIRPAIGPKYIQQHLNRIDGSGLRDRFWRTVLRCWLRLHRLGSPRGETPKVNR